MLGKLMKYDLKSMLKTMLPLWIALVIASVVFSIRLIFFSGATEGAFVSSEGNVSLVIIVMILFGVFVGVFVLNFIVVIQRFWNGLLKDEGYLMFTLPVSSRSLIISKALSALIITVLSILVTVLCFILFVGFGMIGSSANGFDLQRFTEFLRQAWQAAGQAFGDNPLKLVGWILFWIVSGLADLLSDFYHIYLAMAIGQLSNKNRFLMSILAYLAITVIISFAVLTPLGAAGVLSATHVTGPAWIISANGIPSPWVWVISLGLNVLQVIVFHAFTEYLLTKKLNLE